MLKKELESKVDRLVLDLVDERRARKQAENLLSTTVTERNGARALVKEYESKIALLRTSMETLSAIKFPAYDLKNYDTYSGLTEHDRAEQLEDLPEYLLALRHMYALLELGKSVNDSDYLLSSSSR